MASRAVAKVKVDWSKLATQMPPRDVEKLNKLKSACNSTAAKAASLPESLPQIDWAFYKQNASDPKMVEELQKNYASIKIDTPKSPASRMEQLDLAYKQDLARFEKFKTIAESYIESAEVVRKKFETMIPVKDMNHEDWFLTFPHWSWSIDSPSISPHLGRVPGLTREEAAAFDQPDPLPYATKTAWADWEKKYKKNYQ